MPVWINNVISFWLQWTADFQELETYVKGGFLCIMDIETPQILYSNWIYFVIFSILNL